MTQKYGWAPLTSEMNSRLKELKMINEHEVPRREIILAKLIGCKFTGVLRDLPESVFNSVTDGEIEDFYRGGMTPTEKKWASGKYQQNFFENLSAAFERLYPRRKMNVSRTGASIFTEPEPVSESNS